MIGLRMLQAKHNGENELPSEAQYAANAAITGILALNGYFGRKKEWEILSTEHVLKQLDAGKDFLVCQDHKTAHCYGDAAKWLAPGTIAAMRCYLSLPRREGVKTFLCPPMQDQDHVDIPGLLRSFSTRFLPADKTKPRVNLLRKWWHGKLRSLTENEEKLMEIFRALKEHTANVATKHYVVHSPAEDAKLGEQLVTSMLGTTVAWPAVAMVNDTALEELMAVCEQADADEEGGEEDDNEIMEWFPGAHHWGIDKPLDVLLDLPPQAAAPGEASSSSAGPAPAAAAQAPTSSGGAGVKRKAADLHAIPASIIDPDAGGSDETTRRGRMALQIVSLPPQNKLRYFMTDCEKKWATSMFQAVIENTGEEIPKQMFDRLFKWGVFIEALTPDCSPGGLRSMYFRERAKPASNRPPPDA
jgi:hypothetical protein